MPFLRFSAEQLNELPQVQLKAFEFRDLQSLLWPIRSTCVNHIVGLLERTGFGGARSEDRVWQVLTETVSSAVTLSSRLVAACRFCTLETSPLKTAHPTSQRFSCRSRQDHADLDWLLHLFPLVFAGNARSGPFVTLHAKLFFHRVCLMVWYSEYSAISAANGL